jgi:hypothetical protein
MHVRTQKNSDGTTYIWKWDASLGANYMGPKVHLSVVQKKISAAEKERLELCEERRRKTDAEIRRATFQSAEGLFLPYERLR